MRLTRCHVDATLSVGTSLALPDTAANHLARVLRLREGDGCVLFNGDGHDYDARITAISKRGVLADIVGARAVDNESPLHVTLLQGIARGEKMDLILQKATELGVAAIVPVMAERTEVKLDAERTEKRVAHWRSVVASACEQSGRARLPTLALPAALIDAARTFDDGATKLTLDPAGDVSLASVQLAGAAVVVAIGPEGGWSPRDRDTLAAAGFTGLRLGPRILRTETAGLAAIAALQSRFGDL
ncbi:16S rRNA (uracil(1498)-N(3))-methyltransferase [Pseudoxanthomonas mexicana]|uniref:16S rRNA (uracil(1498)-N(3))-methyltransferase n=1 Tax=Pseudoxanthomonas mexicana TaxID=128785 RepID=UPI0007846571|nr:16S rRNA (uracil(1498)-N(3))-methyltransferase [Pseudoxanthomonas mexicana]